MTLFRYIAAEFMRIVAVCITGFVGMALIIELSEKAGTFFKHDATAGQALRYAAFKAPEFLTWMIPAAALMGTLLALIALSRRNEVVAMLAGGIGRRTIALPVITVAALLSGLHFGLAEYVVPKANEAARNILDVEVRQKERSHLSDRAGRWFYAGGSFLRVGAFEGNRLTPVLLLRPGTPGQPPERMEAPGATWDGEGWVLDAGRRIRNTPDGLVIEPMPAGIVLRLGLEPQDLRTEVRNTDEWSFYELRRIIADRQRLGQDVRRETVDLYGKIAFPFAALVMALVALPFGFRSARAGGAARGIVVGLILGFGYYVVMAIGISIGKAGTIPPVIAAWMPNVLFGLVGTYLAVTLDRL